MHPFVIATYLCIFAYLLGSVSSAIIISKIFDLPDPRTQGSKNPGATNVLRLSGRSAAIKVLCFDVIKGFVPVLLARYFEISDVQAGFVAFCAVFGHMFPLYYWFRGGKGVATAIGAYFGLSFMFGIVCLAVWLLIAKLTRYSSLSAIVMVVAAPLIFPMIVPGVDVFFPLGLITLFALVKHRENIGRLMDGTESKIGMKVSEAKSNEE